MIKIVPNKQWAEAAQFLKELPLRYEWFQFEFGKRVANIFSDLLSEDITAIKNAPKGYKKRLVVAEIKDTQQKYWFAVVVKAKPLGSTERTVDNTVLKVVSRFPTGDGDPIHDILQEFGPWSVDMFPYLPSKRYAIVVAEAASEKKVEAVRQKNKNTASEWMKWMQIYGIEYEIRMKIPIALNIIEDLETVVNDMEFSFGPRYAPHWTKALRTLKAGVVRKLLNERDLIASMTDPKFKKYRVKTHIKTKMNSSEIRDLEKFQKRLLKIV